MTNSIPQITAIRHGTPPGGAVGFVLLLAGFSFAISTWIVAFRFAAATCKNRHMHRRAFLLWFPLLTACGKRAVTREEVFPKMIGDWRLAASSDAPPEALREDGSPQGAARAWDATYTGPAVIRIRVYEMSSQAGGLDATQRWRPVANTAIFHHEQYFTVVRWEPVDRNELTKFIRAFEAHVKGLK
jgi:hypothetical protein